MQITKEPTFLLHPLTFWTAGQRPLYLELKSSGTLIILRHFTFSYFKSCHYLLPIFSFSPRNSQMQGHRCHLFNQWLCCSCHWGRGMVWEQIGGCHTWGRREPLLIIRFPPRTWWPMWRNRKTWMPPRPQFMSPSQDVCRCALIAAWGWLDGFCCAKYECDSVLSFMPFSVWLSTRRSGWWVSITYRPFPPTPQLEKVRTGLLWTNQAKPTNLAAICSRQSKVTCTWALRPFKCLPTIARTCAQLMLHSKNSHSTCIWHPLQEVISWRNSIIKG